MAIDRSDHSPHTAYRPLLFQERGGEIVPSKEPMVVRLTVSTKRSVIKLPEAFANRPVPPEMVICSTAKMTPGTSVGVACVSKVPYTVSPLAAVNSNFPFLRGGWPRG